MKLAALLPSFSRSVVPAPDRPVGVGDALARIGADDAAAARMLDEGVPVAVIAETLGLPPALVSPITAPARRPVA